MNFYHNNYSAIAKIFLKEQLALNAKDLRQLTAELYL
jgi:hypothetical protein